MNDPTSIIKIVMYLVLISVVIAKSFGRNPVSGGIPASEHNRISRIR